MKERPILFSASMVNAILAGLKTQTRRILKRQPTDDLSPWPKDSSCICWEDFISQVDYYVQAGYCPYGKPGDRLWVREAWQYHGWTEEGKPWIAYRAGGEPRLCLHTEEWVDRVNDAWEQASDPQGISLVRDKHWRPSLFMPRWASRITLEIVAVRVERLNEISEADAKAEGITYAEAMEMQDSYSAAFRALWHTIHASEGPQGWAANPWVWVVELKPLEGAK